MAFKAPVTKTSAVLLTRGVEAEPVAAQGVVAYMGKAVAGRVGMDEGEADSPDHSGDCGRGDRAGRRSVRTDHGIRSAIFSTEVHNRLLRPLLAADQPQAPPELRVAPKLIGRHADDYAAHARMPRTA